MTRKFELEFAEYMRGQSAPGTATFAMWNARVKKLRAQIAPRASRVIHSSPFEPPDYADEPRDESDDD